MQGVQETVHQTSETSHSRSDSYAESAECEEEPIPINEQTNGSKQNES